MRGAGPPNALPRIPVERAVSARAQMGATGFFSSLPTCSFSESLTNVRCPKAHLFARTLRPFGIDWPEWGFQVEAEPDWIKAAYNVVTFGTLCPANPPPFP
jgi:hypothetical protein